MAIEDTSSGKETNNNLGFQSMDAGTQPPEYFKKRMSPLRFKIREMLVPYTDHQSEQLYALQKKYRTPFRDIYFKYSSLMGAHTFYVMFVPIPSWLGNHEMVCDLVYILGYSIYLSGFLKDYLCLPRPQAPPLERITLSSYTKMEYGAPSSHTATATSTSLYYIWKVWHVQSLSLTMKFFLASLIVFYYVTLVFGRVYCGMHGFLDLVTGAIVGVVCVVGKLVAPIILKKFYTEDYALYPLFSISFALFLLFWHVKPIDKCPCFEDSVAFIGVVSGIEWGDWINKRYQINRTYISGNVSNSPLEICMKLIVGVTLISLWMYVISKPLITKIMSRFVDISKIVKNDGIDIIRRFFRYAGIALTVVCICPFAFTKLHIT